MKGSFRIGRISGIGVYLHWTFLVLLAWLLGSDLLAGHGFVAALSGVGMIVTLFTIIVLHELGHALTARHYGIKTKDITLLPIGGVARLERMPENPIQELWVALAGPAVNVAIAALALVLLAITGGLGLLFKATVGGGSILAQLVWLNLWLAGFNLLPAFPMDGGRVLRALLALRMGRPRATEVAATIGQLMAVVFALVGFFVNPFLMFIALFVWVGAGNEAARVRVQSLLGKLTVREIMADQFMAVDAHLPAREVSKILLEGFQTELPVMDNGRLIGFVSMQETALGIESGGESACASDFARREYASAAPDEPLQQVLPRWEAFGASPLAVVSGGSLVGIVPAGHVADLALLRSAKGSIKAHVGGGPTLKRHIEVR